MLSKTPTIDLLGSLHSRGVQMLSNSYKVQGLLIWWCVALGVVLWWSVQTPPLVDYRAAATNNERCAAVPLWQVDINAASWTEFDTLPGLGAVLSKAIVSDRDARGDFASVDELLRVRGIGPKRLDAVRPFLACSAADVP